VLSWRVPRRRIFNVAHLIIENREREEKGRLVREVRLSNLVDNIHTDWEKY
jgi:hypothetical protein